MDQRPRLSVKDTSRVTTTVVPRTVAEKLTQRHQLALGQKLEVIAVRQPKLDLDVFLDLKSRIVLGKTFVEPRRHIVLSVVRLDDEVDVLVKDRFVRAGVFAL